MADKATKPLRDRLYIKAVELFRKFHKRSPHGNEIVGLKLASFGDDEIVLQIGQCVGMMYKTKDEKKPFLHRFNASNRPLLYVSSDGRQLYILQGGYKFTERGIIG